MPINTQYATAAWHRRAAVMEDITEDAGFPNTDLMITDETTGENDTKVSENANNQLPNLGKRKGNFSPENASTKKALDSTEKLPPLTVHPRNANNSS